MLDATTEMTTLLTPAALGTAALLLIFSLLNQLTRTLRRRSQLSHFPDAGNLDYRVTSQLAEATKKHPGQAVKFTTPHFTKLILPPSSAPSLSTLPPTTASFAASLSREFAGPQTSIGHHHPAMTTHLAALNRHGHAVVALLAAEAPLALSSISPALLRGGPPALAVLRAVAQMSGRVFVGLPLAREEAWVGMNVGYLFDSFGAAGRLVGWPGWVRGWVGVGRRVRGYREVAGRMLRPVVEGRVRGGAEVDMIQWTVESGGVGGVGEHVDVQLALLGVSLLGTTILITFVLYELAAHPELVPALREEIERLRAENGGSLSKELLPKLRKLDSFIKETQRLNSTTAVMLNRMVLKDCTLSDGTFLPAGVDVAVNAMEVNRSEELWKNADVFDGFRFDKLRQESGAESKHQLIKSDLTALNFGLGNQVCPGRFFAGAEIKVLISELLIEYDVAFKDQSTAALSGKFTVEDVFMKPKELSFQKRTSKAEGNQT